MKTLFDKEAEQEVLARIASVSPESKRQWGKMDAGQMLAHCTAAMEVAVADKFPPRLFIGKVLAPLFKSTVMSDKPFAKNGPTDPSFIMTGQKDLNAEKSRLTTIVKRFSEGGKAKVTTHPHSFLGKLTADEWGLLMYKHLDHHLKQFSA